MSNETTTPEQYAQQRLDARTAKYRAQVARLRALAGLTPDPSPAPDVASVPAVDDAAAPPGRDESQDVQQRAGEPRPETECAPDCRPITNPCSVDQRPETACSADGCFRPTRDGICDRCRAKAIADDTAAANAQLVDQLKANQRERAHARPPADPGPPRYFTGADINHDKVHAAQARAATERSSNT